MSEKQQKKSPEKVENSMRRGFLKQIAYVAPTVVVLGALTKPTESRSAPRPPSGPSWS